MLKFNKANTYELRKQLFSSCIHDSKIEKISYNYPENNITIELVNSFFDVKIKIVFCDVVLLLTNKGNWQGSPNAVHSLTIEEDYLRLLDCVPQSYKDIEGSLYLLLQMFSGDELHIVAKEVVVEITR